MYNIKAFLNDISINKMCVLLEKIQPAKIYNKGDFIFHQEDKADCFYFLKSGAIRTFSTSVNGDERTISVSYTHLRAHETKANLVCRLLLEKKKSTQEDFS